MPHELIIFAIVIISASVIVTVVSNVKSKRRRIAAIKAGYGKLPAVDDYLQLKSIGRYKQHMETHKPSRQRVDSITWNDLDMDKVLTASTPVKPR